MRRLLAGVGMWLLTATLAQAAVVLRPFESKSDGKTFDNLLVTDDAFKTKRPGIVLALPNGAGSVDARSRAGTLARLGYVVLSVDLFGKGVAVPKDEKEAAVKAGILPKDRKAVRDTVKAAYTAFVADPQVDPNRMVAIGYGLGGTAMLELARTGVDLEGLAVVGGEVSSPTPTDYKAFQPNVLVLVGADDPHIPPTQTAALEAEMKKAEVDCKVVRFPGTVHDFASLTAGRNVKSGSAYNAESDRKAQDAILGMLSVEVPVKFNTTKPAERKELPKDIPAKAVKVLTWVDEKGEAMNGYEGGRTFLNIERVLPQNDKNGKRIKYREWDVNPLMRGVNRGAERLITSSDGAAYFTDDHYRSFKKVR